VRAARAEEDLRFAHRLADAADAVTTARFRALDLRVDTKPDLTPVSEADRAAEEGIRRVVAASARGEGVLGEELGDDGGDVRWIVDPIDGTKNYVRGIPLWATLLALSREGVVDVALVSAPALGARRWWATRGGGAFADGSRCSVSAVATVEDAVVSTTSSHGMPPAWRALAASAWADRGFGDFWQYCLVAEGSTSRSIRWSICGITPACSCSWRKPAAACPRSRVQRQRMAAHSSPRTGASMTTSSRCSRRAAARLPASDPGLAPPLAPIALLDVLADAPPSRRVLVREDRQ
jgi:histidinol-phosphatase